MNLKLSVFIGAVLLPFVAACTPDQINSVIEACKGDLECYEIIDDAIEEELEARGITGGRMTNIEMIQLTEFLQTYTLGPGSNQMTRQKIDEITSKNYYAGNPESNIEIMTSLENLMNDFYDMNQASPFPNLEIFDITVINSDFKQLFYTGTSFNRTKHVIYKTGTDVFKYEIFGSQEFVFNIQIELDSIFFRDKRYISPLAIYEYFEESLSWESIFSPNPMILDNDWASLAVTFGQTDNGYFILQNGFSYYMKDDPNYSLELPLISYQLTSTKTNKTYYIGASYNGSIESLTAYFNIAIYEYGYENIFIPIREGELVFLVDEANLGQDLSLRDWIEWSQTKTSLPATLDGYTRSEVFQEIEIEFESYLDLPFVLDPVVYPSRS